VSGPEDTAGNKGGNPVVFADLNGGWALRLVLGAGVAGDGQRLSSAVADYLGTWWGRGREA